MTNPTRSPLAHSIATVLLATGMWSAPSASANTIGTQSLQTTPASNKELPAPFAQTKELTPLPQPGVVFKNREFYGRTVAATDGLLAVGAFDATLGGAVYIYHHDGESWSLFQKVRAADGAAEIGFGRALAVDHRFLVVGARDGHSPDTWSCGAVYIFEQIDGRWQQIQRINADEPEADARFGTSVALDDDLLVVGAYDATGATREQTGAVYVFRLVDDRWVQTSKITRPNEDEDRYFGTSVATDGETIIASSPARSQSTGRRWGEVFVFEAQGSDWIPEQQIDLAGVGWARGAVTFYDHWMSVVGNLDPTIDEQRTLVYRRQAGSWVHHQTIAPETPEGELLEVEAVQLTADRLIVATPTDDEAADNAGAVFVYSLTGNTWEFEAKLKVPDSSAGERLGQSVAMTADTVIAGSTGSTDDLQGAAQVFEEVDGGLSHTQVLAPWNVTDAGMGHSIARSGNTLIAGAPGYVNGGIEDCGAVWVFEWDGDRWDMQDMFIADEPRERARFGSAVALHGDTLVIGAPGFQFYKPEDLGAAFVYRRIDNEWRFQQKLTGIGTTQGDHFGAAVAIAPDALFISDPWHQEGGRAGAVYIYDLVDDLYQERQIVTPDQPASWDRFGEALLIHDGKLLIGAPVRDSGDGQRTGVVYVFSKSDGVWTERQELSPIDPSASLGFGSSLATEGNTLVVGAPGVDSPDKLFAGSAHVFSLEGDFWVYQETLIPHGAAAYSRVGTSVAISGNRVVVGSPGFDIGGAWSAGAAHVFTRVGDEWNEQLLTVPDPEVADSFGETISGDHDAFFIAAPDENTIWGNNAGSVYVFEPTTESVDLEITVTNNREIVAKGETPEYTISVANRTATDVHRARVVITFPREFMYYSFDWSFVSTGGATCELPLYPMRLHSEVDMPSGSSLEVTARGQLSPSTGVDETGIEVAVLPPPGLADIDTTNNLASDIDPVETHVDLVITKTNGRDELISGQRTSYGIVIQNLGPSTAARAVVLDTPPSALQDCSWVCYDDFFYHYSSCDHRGLGGIDERVYIYPGYSVYFVLTCDVGEPGSTCRNSASVTTDSAIETNPSDNTSVDEDPIIEIPGGMVRDISGRRSP